MAWRSARRRQRVCAAPVRHPRSAVPVPGRGVAPVATAAAPRSARLPCTLHPLGLSPAFTMPPVPTSIRMATIYPARTDSTWQISAMSARSTRCRLASLDLRGSACATGLIPPSPQPFIGNPKLFGFYLMDEPDPTGQYAPLCTAANLMAEYDWIHAHLPGAKTFIVMMNLGTPTSPTYANTYNPSNTHIDLFGLDPYPVRPQFTGGVNYNV